MTMCLKCVCFIRQLTLKPEPPGNEAAAGIMYEASDGVNNAGSEDGIAGCRFKPERNEQFLLGELIDFPPGFLVFK